MIRIQIDIKESEIAAGFADMASTVMGHSTGVTDAETKLAKRVNDRLKALGEDLMREAGAAGKSSILVERGPLNQPEGED